MKTTDLNKIEKLEERYYRTMFRLAKRLCGNSIEAMVLTQRTFRRAFDYSQTFSLPANKQAWLSAILFDSFVASHQPVIA